ncbi:hypothetical protein K1T71_000562 [Dendrolimus kikuchii]|uniref:Uncharacterized protein n=1 Tax=Dendrolimus kikuchii TaxID=765133 RepID=A0ACC1DJI5_9NEOP|nr:hypothetical protein K1T71_000562 [Dendrolimus kikuchii]
MYQKLWSKPFHGICLNNSQLCIEQRKPKQSELNYLYVYRVLEPQTARKLNKPND